MMDSLSPKPVIELDFRLLTHLPSNADGFGVQMTPAGISLSGPKAYLNLPLALPIGAYLKSKSILVCLRFVNSRESIQLGLESSDGMRSEKLAIGSDLEGVPHGVWVLHRSSQLPTTTFGSSAPVEHEINFDIHLALVVDASRPPTATFTCYRESEQYGQPARLGGLAVFQGSDGIVFTIQHSGSGRVVYSYVKIFDRALSEDEVRQIDLSSAMAGSASASQGEAVPVDTSATNVGQSSLTPMKPSPAHPERWTLKQQQNAAQQESQIDTAYSSGEYKKHVAHVHNFRAACNDRGVDYADALLTGDMTAEEYRKVEAAKAHLKSFWKKVRGLYNTCQLTADGGDFFSPDKKWLRAAHDYQALFEPLSIAGWYKHGNHLKGSGHYIGKVPQPGSNTSAKTSQPRRTS
eukprot:TRINITY_DN503_c0_g1_i1.p1 TRINITY_DN503_c0_g1~~TRINITY_DN503_c0_g1_i1.p1  ORF type:complete len:406 (+),score=47.02 TRINITY_DN503_c0_g1_i1:254-1471(+)